MKIKIANFGLQKAIMDMKNISDLVDDVQFFTKAEWRQSQRSRSDDKIMLEWSGGFVIIQTNYKYLLNHIFVVNRKLILDILRTEAKSNFLQLQIPFYSKEQVEEIMIEFQDFPVVFDPDEHGGFPSGRHAKKVPLNSLVNRVDGGTPIYGDILIYGDDIKFYLEGPYTEPQYILRSNNIVMNYIVYRQSGADIITLPTEPYESAFYEAMNGHLILFKSYYRYETIKHDILTKYFKIPSSTTVSPAINTNISHIQSSPSIINTDITPIQSTSSTINANISNIQSSSRTSSSQIINTKISHIQSSPPTSSPQIINKNISNVQSTSSTSSQGTIDPITVPTEFIFPTSSAYIIKSPPLYRESIAPISSAHINKPQMHMLHPQIMDVPSNSPYIIKPPMGLLHYQNIKIPINIPQTIKTPVVLPTPKTGLCTPTLKYI